MYTRLIPFHQAPSQNFSSFLKMVLQTFQDYVLVEEKKKCSYFSHIKENALSEFFTHVFICIRHWVRLYIRILYGTFGHSDHIWYYICTISKKKTKKKKLVTFVSHSDTLLCIVLSTICSLKIKQLVFVKLKKMLYSITILLF